MGRTEGKNGSFLAKKDENPPTFFIHDPLENLKKREEGQEIIPKFMIVYIYHCYCIVGHSLGALMYLKPKTLSNVYLNSFLQLHQKIQVSG